MTPLPRDPVLRSMSRLGLMLLLASAAASEEAPCTDPDKMRWDCGESNACSYNIRLITGKQRNSAEGFGCSIFSTSWATSLSK